MEILSTFSSSSDAVRATQARLSARMRARPHTPWCVVMDIDDTLLRETDTVFRVNPAVVAMYHWCFKRGCILYLVTARKNDTVSRAFTHKQLELLGLTKHKKVYHTPDKWRADMASISRFKMACRDRVASHCNGNLLLTVGDSWSDIVAATNEKDLDRITRLVRGPYALVRLPKGNSAIYGLKLKNYGG